MTKTMPEATMCQTGRRTGQGGETAPPFSGDPAPGFECGAASENWRTGLRGRTSLSLAGEGWAAASHERLEPKEKGSEPPP